MLVIATATATTTTISILIIIIIITTVVGIETSEWSSRVPRYGSGKSQRRRTSLKRRSCAERYAPSACELNASRARIWDETGAYASKPRGTALCEVGI